MLEELRSEFDLYSGYEDEFVESVFALDEQDALFDHEMMTVYQFLGVEEQSGARLLALMAGRLAAIADADSVDPPVGARAASLAEVWRERLFASEDGEYLTVAQVAARYGVTPQAVYKWIHSGKIEAEERPGGSYRVPASQFRSSTSLLEKRVETRRKLRDLQRGRPLSDQEIVAALRESRRDDGSD
jgi:excisionase family DNA binding protein